MSELRVLAYNVYSLRRGVDEVARVIRAIDPDVACIQEAPRFWGWRRKCAALAAAAKLDLITGGRPAGSVLLLARPGLTVVDHRSMKLPWHPPLHRRGVAIGVFEKDGHGVAIGSVHCSLEPHERLAHLPLALEALRAYDVPTVLAGDINETPSDPAWRMLTAELQDAYAVAPVGGEFTSTARHPHQRIDGVFVDGRLKVLGAGVPDVPNLAKASDHCPVVATVEFPT